MDCFLLPGSPLHFRTSQQIIFFSFLQIVVKKGTAFTKALPKTIKVHLFHINMQPWTPMHGHEISAALMNITFSSLKSPRLHKNMKHGV